MRDRAPGSVTLVLDESIQRCADLHPRPFVANILTDGGVEEVVTNCDHLSRLRFSPVLPNAFTEHGAIMAATVLNSPRAVEMSVFVVRAFVKMRERLLDRADMEKRLAQIEKGLLAHDASLRDLYRQIRPLLLPPPEPPRKPIGFQLKERRVPYRTKKTP